MTYSAEAYVSILTGFLSTRNAKYICIPHTSTGFEYGPALAVKLLASCVSGVEGINSDSGIICLSRTAISGKIEMKINPLCPTAVLTIMPGAFKAKGRPEKAASGSYEIIISSFSLQKTKTIKILQAEKDDYPINEAEVIVSAGRGIGKKENLELIYRLAGIFERSAIGSSRPICDLGWLGYKHQVGTTGKTVAPKLYIACGISGTVQHVSGIKGANLIVAVNTDPNAAIFNTADYCIVEDTITFIPVLIEEYYRRRSALSGD
jgi:electron transfer flavoprotein alpha subunit